VEHPVTELVTGLDLVAWQLTVAAGNSLPLQQEDIQLRGHAVEVRLYAEDPRKQFMPQTGDVALWQVPVRAGIRVDHGIQQGQAISPFYDPMLAKVIAWGESREEACRKLASAVQDTTLLGVNNNKYFLQRVLRHPSFLDGSATTAFIEQHFQQDESLDDGGPCRDTLALAALLTFSRGQRTDTSWRNSSGARHNFRLRCEGEVYVVKLQQASGITKASCNDSTVELSLLDLADNACRVLRNGICEHHAYGYSGGMLHLDAGTGHYSFEDVTHAPASAASGVGSGQVTASMDGAIIDVLATKGDVVTVGQTLVVLEAMKMEHQLKAAIDGVVDSVHAHTGDQVKERQVLLTVVPHPEAAD